MESESRVSYGRENCNIESQAANSAKRIDWWEAGKRWGPRKVFTEVKETVSE